MSLAAPAFLDDSDVEFSPGRGLTVIHSGWWLPEHGITTSTCDWWAHYSPFESVFYCYRTAEMLGLLSRGSAPVVYVGPLFKPSSRGYLVSRQGLALIEIKAHPAFSGEGLRDMPRFKAGKLAELHFMGAIYEGGGGFEFAEAWQDRKGNDIRLPNGEWWQLKLDRRAAQTGNLYVETHTRSKDTTWGENI